MTEERAEKNELLDGLTDDGIVAVFDGWWNPAHDSWQLELPDFYLSEEASAMALEKMPNVRLTRLPASRSWACDYDWCKSEKDGNLSVGYGHGLGMEAKDRKTAICEAALALIMQEQK